MVAITSEYGYWPYVIAALVFTLFPLIVLSIGLGCIARGAVFGKFVVTPFHMKIVGGIVAFVGTCFSTALAFAAGFWVMPTAASGFICFVVWAVLSPIAVMLFSEQVRFLIDPSTRSFRTAGTSPSHLHFTRSDQHFAVEMSRTPSSTQSPDILSTEASATLLFTPERSTAVSGAYPPTAAAFPEKAHPIEVVKPTDVPHQPRNRLENFWFCLRDDMMERKYVHAGVFLAALVGSALLILFIHNSCVCNKPQIMTTWISRKSETTYCAPDSVCFTYFMVGDNCSSLVAVAHFVQGSSGFTPTLAHAQVCMAPPGSSSAVCQPYAGILRPMDDIAEDMRYIAQVPLTNLQCNTTYYVNVIFDGPGGTSQQGPSKCVTTIPSAPRAPPGSNAADAFCFVGGGDYVVNDAGLPLLKRAMMQCPAAAFAFIGGDLGYDNNMRTCYKRTDRMLWEWTTALVRGDNQCSVPILTSIGNHDGGGYQWAGASTLATASGRADNNAFYLKYYPSRSLDTSLTGNQPAAARDWTQTTHVHDVGGVFGMIILDTGHILAVDSQQQQFLQQSFDYFRRKAMPVTLLYHVPAHPSVRAAEGGNSQTVLDNFVPLFDANDDLITLIFENHDHSYKRTKRLTNTNVATTNASSVPELRLPGRGVIYSGDGALGAHTSSDQGNLEDMGLTKNNNYVMVIRVMTNGSFAAEAWALDSAVTPMDAFLAV